MNLSNLFRDLALGELSNLSLSEGGTIKIDKRPSITMFANDGLLALHSRFLLKEKDMIVEMREGVTNYHLLKRYAWSQYSEESPPDRFYEPYIMDTISEPFEEDVIKILSVYNSFGQKLPLNDHETFTSVFSLQSNVLQIPFPIANQAVSIEYQAKHAKLNHCECNDEISLPEILWKPLRLYIASQYCTNMNTQEMTAKGQEHMMMYDMLCQEVVEKDIVNSSTSTTNTRFEKRGWI